MSRTKRIYNRRLKKAQRYYWDFPKIYDERGVGLPINNVIIGIPYTFRSFICMGRCPICRNKNREPRLLRKRLKESLRLNFRNEFNTTEVEIYDSNK